MDTVENERIQSGKEGERNLMVHMCKTLGQLPKHHTKTLEEVLLIICTYLPT